MDAGPPERPARVAITGEARISNVTNAHPSMSDLPLVYWQTSDWLAEAGLVIEHPMPDGMHVVLTAAGTEWANRLASQLELFDVVGGS